MGKSADVASKADSRQGVTAPSQQPMTCPLRARPPHRTPAAILTGRSCARFTSSFKALASESLSTQMCCDLQECHLAFTGYNSMPRVPLSLCWTPLSCVRLCAVRHLILVRSYSSKPARTAFPQRYRGLCTAVNAFARSNLF